MLKQIQAPTFPSSGSEVCAPRSAPAAITADNLPLSYDHAADRAIPDRTVCDWSMDQMPVTLRRPLRADERGAIERRVGSLAPALEPFHPTERDRVADALLGLFDSFTQMRQKGADAMARVSDALEVAADMPAWAIEEACLTIRKYGYEHRDPDTGRVRLEQHWPPSDGEVHEAVRRVVQGRATALARARAMLEAPALEQPPPRPTGRAVDVVLAEYREQVGPTEVDARQAEEIREQRSRAISDRTIEDRRREYVLAGLPPPTVAMFSSLPMMLKSGYTIETIKGERVLVGPTKRKVGGSQ